MSSLAQDLLPGIPDAITFTHIATKLPWTAFHVLSSVSRKWQQKIQHREVYTERIRCQSTETLIVVKHHDRGLPPRNRCRICLCSMREKASYKLPPIPQFEDGISKYSQFISMDGKLYVLGAGSECEIDSEENMSAHVLDLAGQSRWTMCRSVPKPERGYEFNIGHGLRMGGKNIGVVGSENWYKSFRQECDIKVPAEWRVGGFPWRSISRIGPWFIVQGKIYWIRMGQRGKNHEIEAYDASTKSLTHQHSISWEEIASEIVAAIARSRQPLRVYPMYILPANHELYLLARWRKNYRERHNPHSSRRASGFCLLQSKGFGSARKDIAWENVGSQSPWRFGVNPYSTTACPIQL